MERSRRPKLYRFKQYSDNLFLYFCGTSARCFFFSSLFLRGKRSVFRQFHASGEKKSENGEKEKKGGETLIDDDDDDDE